MACSNSTTCWLQTGRGTPLAGTPAAVLFTMHAPAGDATPVMAMPPRGVHRARRARTSLLAGDRRSRGDDYRRRPLLVVPYSRLIRE